MGHPESPPPKTIREAVEALGNKVWETLKLKEPREVLTMIPNEKVIFLMSSSYF